MPTSPIVSIFSRMTMRPALSQFIWSRSLTAGGLLRRPPGARLRTPFWACRGGGGGCWCAAVAAPGASVPLGPAPLGADAAGELAPMFPSYFSVRNPLDLTGSATDFMFADAIEKSMSKGGCDIAIVAALWGPPGLAHEVTGLL